MNQKIFAKIISVIIIVLVFLAAGTEIYFCQKFSLNKEFLRQFQQIQEEGQKLRDQIQKLQHQVNNLQNQMTRPQKEEEVMEGAENIKAIGYIKNVYDKNGKRYLDIDFVKFLSESAGTCRGWGDPEVPGIPECGPDGYLIVNENPETMTFEISKNVEIIMQTYGSGECGVEWNEKINYETFKNFWESNPICPFLKDAPYHIEVQNGIITKVIEQYIP